MVLHFILGVFIVFFTYILAANNRYKWFYIIYKTIGRDLRALVRFVKLNLILWRYEKAGVTVPKRFEKLALKHPNKIAFYFEDQIWTFADVNKYSNKVANYFLKQGFKNGDSIALLLDSRPEYACFWLGLSKIGVATALINTNLVGDSLVHSLTAANAKGIIYGNNFKKDIEEIREKISGMSSYEWFDKNYDDNTFNTNLEAESTEFLFTARNSSPKKKLLYIYTSGTTGLPKAAVITHLRFAFFTMGLHIMSDQNEDDIIYNPLPLYHSSGTIVGVGQCMLLGKSMVLRKKFSASNYWTECAKFNCTVAQYIGEMCRYVLVAHNKNASVVKHKVKKMYGNGLRPQIWKEFISTFKVKHIFEFYGSTEGNSNLININNAVGAVGFVPRYAYFAYPVTLIRCDEQTGEPIRNSKGFFTRCSPGEPGIFIGVVNPKKAINNFSGYADKQATMKKILRNVFRNGDTYFNSGDILVQDEFGNYFFKDRTGDTFRWKGENVSTSEIEATISNIVGLNDAVVYGVQIPNTEGRAGMVSILDESNTINIRILQAKLKEKLPGYAVPIFIRILETTPLTGTFKLKKVDLQADGFNINKIQDKIYFADPVTSAYTELSEEKYNEIMSGKLRL